MGIQITVREVDEKVFREFKAEAVRQKITLGGALNFAMEKFRADLSKKRPKLTYWQPSSWGPGSEHVSERIDEILYG